MPFDPKAYLEENKSLLGASSIKSKSDTFDPHSYLDKQLEELSGEDPIEMAAQNPDTIEVAKEIFRKKQRAPITSGQIGAAVMGAPVAAWDAITGFGSGIKSAIETPLETVKHGAGSPEARRAATEGAAALEMAGANVMDLARGAKRLPGRVGRLFGVDAAKLTDEDIDEMFHEELGMRQVQKELQGGKLVHEGVQGLLGTPEELTAEGAPIRPERIANMASVVDPTNVIEAGAFVPGVNKLTGKVAALPLKAAGATVKGVGQLAAKTMGTKGTALGATIAAATGHPGVAAGAVAARVIAPKVGSLLTEAGNELAGAAARDGQSLLSTAFKETIKGTAAGATTGAGFAILTADTPEEAVNQIAAGAGLGATGGASKAGAEPFARSIAKQARGDVLRKAGEGLKYGLGLDEVHEAAAQRLSPQDRAVLDKYRGFTAGLTNPDGTPIQVYAVDAETFKNRTGGDGTERGAASKDGSEVYINVDAPEASGATETLGHEFGHVTDALAGLLGPKVGEALTNSIQKSLHNADGTRTKEFDDFVKSYADKAKVSEVDAEGEFVAETARRILQGGDIEKFAIPKALADRLKDGVSDFGKWLGAGKGKDSAFDWREAPAVTKALRKAFYEIGKSRPEEGTVAAQDPNIVTRTRQIDARIEELNRTPAAKKTPAVVDEIAALQRERIKLNPEPPAGTPPAPTSETQTDPYTDIGIDQEIADAVRDYHIAPPGGEPRTQRANAKLGVQGKSADKVAEDRAKEWDEMFADFTNEARDQGLEVPKNVRELHQAVIEHSLRQGQRNVRPTRQTAEPALASLDLTPAPRSQEPALAGFEPPGARTTAPEAPRVPAPIPEKAADPIVQRLTEVETDTRVSPEFAAKKTEATKEKLVKQARQEALLEIVTEDGNDNPDLLQRRVRDGETTYSGRIDLGLPSHRALLDELGVPESAHDTIRALEENLGNVVSVDYRSAENLQPGDTSGTQRRAEYAASTAEARRSGAPAFEAKGKPFLPVKFKVWPSGKLTVLGFSPERLISNAGKLINFLRGQKIRIGYKGVNDPNLIADIQGYVRNHKANYKGDGSGPVADAKIEEGYEPYKIPRNRMDLINAAMNADVSTKMAAKGEATREKAMDAQARALENDWRVDDETGDTNPLRALINKSGKFKTVTAEGKTRQGTGEILESVWENLSPELIENVQPGDAAFGEGSLWRRTVRPAGFRGSPTEVVKSGLPDWSKVEAGFMPDTGGESNAKASIEKNKRDALMMTGDDNEKAAAFLERYAASAKDPEVAQNLRDAAKELSSSIKSKMPDEPPALSNFMPGAEQPKRDKLGFYSKLEEVAAEKVRGKVTPDQLRATLKNNGVKTEELDWILGDLLDRKKGQSITPEELRAEIEANRIELKEVEKGKKESINRGNKYAIPEVVRLGEQFQGDASDALRLTLENDGDAYRALTRKFPELDDNENWADIVMLNVFNNAKNAVETKFSQYQLPGGENYRELLYQLPKVQQSNEIESLKTKLTEADNVIQRAIDLPSKTVAQNESRTAAIDKAVEQAKELRSRLHSLTGDPYAKSPEFKSSHFYEPNVIFHARVNDRQTADGDSMLFAEEVQSDWHQKGRKGGYALTPDNEKVKRLGEEWKQAKERVVQAAAKAGWTWTDFVSNHPEGKKLGAEADAAFQRFDDATSRGVPDAPFKNEGWKRLAIKRLISKAIEEGKNRIGWTTGEQQAERYDLSKHLKSVRLYNMEPDKEGDRYMVQARDNKNQVVIEQPYYASELPNVIGKELADRALEDLADKAVGPLESGLRDAVTYSGLDLKVGGEGMRGFYDKELVNIANDIGKKYGARVEKVKLGAKGEAKIERINAGHWRAHLSDGTWARFSTEENAKEYFTRFEPRIDETEAWSLPITDKIKEAVGKGQAMFMPATGEARDKIDDLSRQITNLWYEEPRNEAKIKALKAERDSIYGEVHRQEREAADRQVSKGAESETVPTPPKGSLPEGHRAVAHWSSTGELSTLDPSFHGKGATGAESKRRKAFPDRYVDRTYFGYGDYRQEPNTGNNRYVGDLDFRQLYDQDKDPLQLSELAVKYAGDSPEPGRIATEFERLVKEHGYLGLHSDEAQVAAVFHKVPAGGSIGSKQFAENAPEYERRSPQMIRALHDLVPNFDQIEDAYFQPKPLDGPQVEKQNKIAREYDKLKVNNLSDPNVSRAYESLVEKVNQQYDKILEGVKIEPWTKEGQPYKNSRELQQDLRNGHLYFFPTTPDSYGKSQDDFSAGHPMLESSGKTTEGGYKLLNNDILRAVHDAIAHGSFGVQFGPSGEEAAWKAHMATIAEPWARWALTTETRGQNSWVNFRDEYINDKGMPKKKGDEGYVPPQDRPFADQKADLIPAEFMLTGDRTVDTVITNNPEFREAAGLGPVARDRKGQFLPTRGEALANFMPATRKDSTALGELDLGKKFTPEAMRQDAIKRRVKTKQAQFPEALPVEYKKVDGKFKVDDYGRPQAETIEYNLDEAPLAKQAARGLRGEKRTEAITKSYGDRLVEQFEKIKDQPEIMQGKEWYKLARTKIKEHFGEDTILFSQLLAATSARTPAVDNFTQALDAYNQFKEGKYDGIAEKYLKLEPKLESGELQFRRSIGEHEMGETVTRKSFKDYLDSEGLLPRKENGKKFNANSLAVLNVLAGVWAQRVGGPKTPQFANNLSGKDLSATIDVWSGRILHRVGSEGMAQRWRILPEAETAVSDNDFKIGQAAFRHAADKLGMSPDDLQAVLWFAEKHLWDKNKWTRGAGAEKSDFHSLLDKMKTEGGRKVLEEPALTGMLF